MKFPILQSGFLALNELGLVRSEPINEDSFVRAIELGKPTDPAGNVFFYNKDVQLLYERFINDHKVIRQFEFREELFKLTKMLLGGHSFPYWVTLQLQSPYLTATHRRFLNDTMRYIFTGEREVSCENWMGLIYSRTAIAEDAKTELMIKEYFSGPRPKLSSGFIDLIAQWTQHSYGVNDLLHFLAIVFSKQSATTV